jgi:alanine racemase
VAGVDEALELRTPRKHDNAVLPEGIGDKPVLVLGYTPPEFFRQAVVNDITLTVYRVEDGEELSKIALSEGRIAKVHIAVDTGMSRIGVSADEKGLMTAKKISELPNLFVEGVFSHYATADEKDKTAAVKQKVLFDEFVLKLKEEGVEPPIIHISNSAGIMEFPVTCNMVRAGIVLYGHYPSCDVNTDNFPLKPVMSVVAHVTNVFELKKGRGVSYGHTFIAEKDMKVAVFSAGYADGYPRALSNKGCVLINGKRCRILGRVCMDQTMVDVTGLSDVKVGDEAVLFGNSQNELLSAEEVSEIAGSFNYEILCGVGRRVTRAYYVDGKCAEVVSYL